MLPSHFDLRCRGLAVFDKRFQPAENSFPPLAMTSGVGTIALESFLANSYESARAGIFRAAGMQCVHRLRLEFPAYESG